MSAAAPGPGVLASFGITGADPVLLPGGQGRTFVVGDVVVRRVDGDEVDAWIAQTMAGVVEDGFRVPRPLRPVRADGAGSVGGWSVDGWSTWTRVQGSTAGDPDPDPGAGAVDWPRGLEVAQRFTAALAHLARPSFVGRRDDVFAQADRIAWGDRPFAVTRRLSGDLAALLDRLRSLDRPVAGAPQVVHGDLAGNLLWADGQPPAVIDLSPFWRPAGLAVAQVVVDAVLWYGAEPALGDLLAPRDAGPLVVRALVFRLAIHALMAQGGRDDVIWDERQVARDVARGEMLADWVARRDRRRRLRPVATERERRLAQRVGGRDLVHRVEDVAEVDDQPAVDRP